MNLDYFHLARALTPEASLLVGALAVLAFDIGLMRGKSALTRLQWAVTLAGLAVTGALVSTVWGRPTGPIFGGVIVLDSLAVAVRAGVLVLALLTLWLSCGARVSRHPAEYVAIILFATAGFTLMAAAQTLLMAFLALELASLSLYILTGFDKASPDSAEAGLKYYLFGGISSAFLLFGFSLIYGLTGSIEFVHISSALAHQGNSPLLTVALVMVLVAFGYKAAAAPFHLWAPDVYQGAPAPSAALVASASKLAGLVLFTRLLWSGLGEAAGDATTFHGDAGWMTVVVVISVSSVALGNLVALAQVNVRRLLAYSAIAHAGALLLGVVATGGSGPGPLFFYAVTYGLATAGAFGVLGVLERNGCGSRLDDLAGLHRRSPLLTACLMVFVLSLAGVPPLAGFFGKFAVFAAALQMGGLHGPLGGAVVVAILFSAVGLYYYLAILRQAVVADPAPSASERMNVSLPAAIALIAAAILLIVLGVFPSLLLGLI